MSIWNKSNIENKRTSVAKKMESQMAGAYMQLRVYMPWLID